MCSPEDHDVYHSFLDFQNLNFYGRDQEVATLKQAYDAASSSSAHQVVWLGGSPGVGKSALVEHLFHTNDFYCSGKFEQLRTTSVPYSALTQLLTTLCYVLECEEDLKIASLSSADESILAQLVPEITTILVHNDKDTSAGSCNLEWGLERLKQALRAFLRAVCDTVKSPVIMFLDDLQWADPDSLEILKDVLIGDNDKDTDVEQQGNGILFIGAYRDNEVQEDSHPLAQCMRTIAQCVEQEPDYRISELRIANLGETATNQLVADLLNTKPQHVVELSKLLYSKTEGNCFYTLHALRHIHEKQFLYVSKKTLQWEWDADGIVEEVQVSDDIAEFMMKKLKQLPQPTLSALSLLAFLGTKVEINLLQSLLPMIYYPNNNSTPPFLKLLQPAIDASLIEVVRNKENFDTKFVKFTHDRVTTAAYNLIPEGLRRKTLHLKIGWQLHSFLVSDGATDGEGAFDVSTACTTDNSQWQLVLAVNQLNQGADLIKEKIEQVLLARLNLKAAQQVVHTGAFKLATRFLETGIGLLGVDRWHTSYELTLQLSGTLASVLYSNGRMEECTKLLQEIFTNATCPEDRYDAHSIQVEVLESIGEIDQCLQVGLDTLVELGHPKISKKPHLGHIIVGVVTARRALKRMSEDDILSMPDCTDPQKEFFMRHLNCLSTIAYFASHDELMVVLSYRVLQLTLRYGVTRYSSYSFFSHACSLAIMGDLDGAFRFAELAVRLMQRFPPDYRTSSCAYCLLYHLKKPIHECINSSLQVYNDAFSTGDLRSVGTACVMHCTHRYTAGHPLETIAKDAFGFCNQLKKYQQSLMFKYLLYILRSVLLLMGRSDEITCFVVNAKDDREFESFVASDGDKNGLNDFWLLVMVTRYRLGDLDSALEFGEKSWKAKGPSGFFVFSATNLFFSALTALRAWKRRRKRRYWRMFRKCQKELATWVEHGNLNTRHLVLLLDAELAVVKKRRPEIVRSMFESSISLASRCGFVHDAALASEQAGQHCLKENDMYWAEHYLANAHELYTDWTATAKVTQMETTYETLKPAKILKSPSQSFDGTPTTRRQSNVSLTGRSRLALVAQVEAKHEGFSRTMGRSVRLMGSI